MALLLLAPGLGQAQKVRVDQANGRVKVSNGLPARIAVLLISYGPRGAEEYVTGVVDANGSTELRARGHSPYVLARIEPLHARVGTTATAGMDCDTRAVARTLPLRGDSLRATLDHLNLEGTREAEEEIAVASQLAQAELQQHLDELQLKSFMYHSLREADTASDWSDVQRRNKEDSDQQRDQLIGQMAYTALAHDEELQAKLRVLDRQADAMQKVAEQADSAIQLVDGMARGAQVEAEGGRALDELVYREMSALHERGAVTLDDPGELARVCAEAATVSDWIRVHASADRSRSIALAHVEYDNGGAHVAPLRRVAGSDEWVLHLYWPSSARRVTVRFTDAAGHSLERRLDLGHQPLRQSVDAAHKRLEEIKKKYKNTRYRAEGGDQLKTIIVP
jgi:hypothetical protein